MRDQFEKTTTKIKNLIRKDKLTDRHQTDDSAKRKESLSNRSAEQGHFFEKNGTATIFPAIRGQHGKTQNDT